jgi:hypothetical protein
VKYTILLRILNTVTEYIIGPRAFPIVKGKERLRTLIILDRIEGRRIKGSRNPLLNRAG